MTNLVTYTHSGPISRIVMDDGKVNVMSLAMLEALHAAFDEAEREKTVVVLTGRGASKRHPRLSRRLSDCLPTLHL